MYRVSKSKREEKDIVREEKIVQFKIIFKDVSRQSTVDSIHDTSSDFVCK